ncbi:hypothetical protein Rs2_17826 [Raphanus sativus]|uniref:Uncharacterized protein LOC108855616 n=1 Tax=Raphanus sativus TaxID=3726 RepID=A0A6J0NLJ9_RAPSA|nr:uncharacterized protein LOC108855616 [Raphanus sativus]KAJ4903875.1 hypothetical protein Rs2_17826 [Raphanus sativus]
MPFHTKIQPIDASEDLPKMKQMPKSRLKRLFERQFSIKNTTSERLFTVGEFDAPPPPLSRGNSGDLEPSSVCLEKMVVNFIEGNNNNNNKNKEEEKQRCGRSRCSCFNGSGTESSDDESEWSDDLKCSSGEACVMLKSLVQCTSICERNLMADVTKIVETSKRKDQSCLKSLVSVLVSLGYDAAICKSRWEKSPSYPAGVYEYVDVIIHGGGERLLIDIDFKSNFEIARATKTYKSILQTLPSVFVGKADRLQRILLLLAKAAKQSLKKRGLHVPPWRRPEYVTSKWLSAYVRGEDKQETVDMLIASVGSIVFGV